MNEQQFKDVVNRYQLDRNTYPHSEKGQRMLTGIIKHFFIIIITGVLGVGSLVGSRMINEVQPLTEHEIEQIEEQQKSESSAVNGEGEPNTYLETQVYTWTGIDLTKDKVYTGGSDLELLENGEKRVWYLAWLKRGLDIFGRLMITFTLLSVFMFSFRFIQYGRNILKRQRLYERNIILNDIQADLFRRRLIGSLSLRSRAADHRANMSGKSGRTTVEDLDRKNMFKTLRKTQVLINTRNDIDDMDKLITQHRIFVDLDKYNTNKNQLDMIKKEVESWSGEATRLKRGLLSFGSMFVSDDQSYIVIRATSETHDPYRVSETGEDLTDNTVYQSVYPSMLLFDNQEEIDIKKENAVKWSEAAKKILSSVLNTKKVNLNIIDEETKISSTSVRFLYEIPETSELPDFSSIPKVIDATFKTVGSSAVLESDKVEVLIPLPKDYHTPINVPTLFRDVFGEVETVEGDYDVNVKDFMGHIDKDKK